MGANKEALYEKQNSIDDTDQEYEELSEHEKEVERYNDLQQDVEEAKGKASALTIESAAINSNPQILQLRAIEKWNGVLPQVTSGATPFINLK